MKASCSGVTLTAPDVNPVAVQPVPSHIRCVRVFVRNDRVRVVMVVFWFGLKVEEWGVAFVGA